MGSRALFVLIGNRLETNILYKTGTSALELVERVPVEAYHRLYTAIPARPLVWREVCRQKISSSG